jgi:hypothetical protein
MSRGEAVHPLLSHIGTVLDVLLPTLLLLGETARGAAPLSGQLDAAHECLVARVAHTVHLYYFPAYGHIRMLEK